MSGPRQPSRIQAWLGLSGSSLKSSASNSGKCGSPSLCQNVEECLVSQVRCQVLERYTGEWNELDATLLDRDSVERYLVARQNDPEKATVMLLESLAWRAETFPERISVAEVVPILSWGSSYFLGHDRAQRPILVSLIRRDRDDLVSLKPRMVVFMMETAIQRMKAEGDKKIVWLIDFVDFPPYLMNSAHVSMAQTVIKVLSLHYPERLGAVLALNAPFLLKLFWRLIDPWIDSRTASKISVYRSRDIQALGQLIDPAILPKRWGGDAKDAEIPIAGFISDLRAEEEARAVAVLAKKGQRVTSESLRQRFGLEKAPAARQPSAR